MTSTTPESNAETTLHSLIAHLAHRSATAETTDPPCAATVAEETGRVPVPSYRRGYQSAVRLVAEGALDHVVEECGYCDWQTVADLHAAYYSPAYDPDAAEDDPEPEPASDADGEADADTDPEVLTDGGLATAPDPRDHDRDRDRDCGRPVDHETDLPPPSQMPPHAPAVARFVAAHHDDYPDGVPHGAVVRHLLLDCGVGPDHATTSVEQAVAVGLIHAAAENRYRPTELIHQL